MCGFAGIKNYNSNPVVLAKKIKGMKSKDVVHEVSKSKFSKYIEAFNSFFINGLLGGTYTQAPFEDITKKKFIELEKSLMNIDLFNVIEDDDNTNLSGELACAGGACEIR